MSRFTKIGTEGEKLGDDATEWVAVLDNTTSLIWTVDDVRVRSTKAAETAVTKLTTAGFTDWRVPTCDELQTILDRTRYSPAIDTNYFPGCKSDWYRTSTPVASSPGCVWLVNFYFGFVGWGYVDYEGFVRGVRASQ